jgi:hypothetical protein
VSTDRVSSSSSLTELAKALGLARRGRAAKEDKGRLVSAGRLAGAAHDSAVLRKQLKALADRIDPDDEAAVEAVRRPVLQEIVLWEFGSDFRQDPEFGPMMDGIEQAFLADPRSSERLCRLIRHLRK